MEAADLPETFVSVSQSNRRHMPQYNNQQRDRRQDAKFYD
jgi:hypothetical protein